jgi:hypothetical protein
MFLLNPITSTEGNLKWYTLPDIMEAPTYVRGKYYIYQKGKHSFFYTYKNIVIAHLSHVNVVFKDCIIDKTPYPMKTELELMMYEEPFKNAHAMMEKGIKLLQRKEE